jgi:hypothetical protein
MKTNYSLFRIALVLAAGGAFLLPVSAPAPTVDITILQFYVGFSQSIRDPGLRGPAALNIPTQTPDGDFQGFITILGNTYAITGKVDNNGNLKFSSGRAGGVTGTGKWQDLTRGGALLLATYKLASGDQGKIDLLRKFNPPPEPDTPPDIAGHWGGTFESSLSLMRGTVEWNVQQDRTPTGAPGTGFTGEETRDTGTPAIQLYKFAGIIDGQGNFVRIGVSELGFVIEGGKFEDQAVELRANANLYFFDGGVDDLVIVITRN